ncbi:MAG: hypothetical protein LIO93_03765, partial [Bacteroidales bacterium]|nr:hypothetical protein [Bacteroidales bacterium]
ADYSFRHTNYSGTITYPSGKEFLVNSILFLDSKNLQIRIMVPANTVVEEGESPYITAIVGKYEHTRNGNESALITFEETADISFGTVAGSETRRVSNLSRYVPTKYELIFDRKDGKINDKITNLESSTGIRIVATGN